MLYTSFFFFNGHILRVFFFFMGAASLVDQVVKNLPAMQKT